MEKIRVCIIGGGSRLWAIQFLKDLTLQNKLSAHVVLYDIDRKAAENNEAVANEIFRINGKADMLSVSVASTLDEGLKGGDFVIIAIEPGLTEIRKRWPDVTFMTQGEFGLLWREAYKSNNFDYQFVEKGSGIFPGSHRLSESN